MPFGGPGGRPWRLPSFGLCKAELVVNLAEVAIESGLDDVPVEKLLLPTDDWRLEPGADVMGIWKLNDSKPGFFFLRPSQFSRML